MVYIAVQENEPKGIHVKVYINKFSYLSYLEPWL